MFIGLGEAEAARGTASGAEALFEIILGRGGGSSGAEGAFEIKLLDSAEVRTEGEVGDSERTGDTGDGFNFGSFSCSEGSRIAFDKGDGVGIVDPG